jgi:hypothetical protein
LADEMTITLTSSKYPRKLIDYLRDELKVRVEAAGSGIYYVKGTDIDTQILVSKQLDDRETGYLKLLQTYRFDGKLDVGIHKKYKESVVCSDNGCIGESKSQ